METAQAQSVKGGVATIFVTDMDRAVRFYTEALGLNLAFRAGDHWASIDAGEGFMLGLHPVSKDSPPAGVNGGVQIGFNVTRQLEQVMRELESRGVSFPDGIYNDGGNIRLAFFSDPEGNRHYLCEQAGSY
jgi:predicted enzyme related to lactoylglutathione lyase